MSPRKLKQPRQKFTAEDDQKLRELVEVNGSGDWRLISKLMGNKTTRQCRERYNNYLNPSLNISKWTPEEEMLLEEKINEIGQRWSLLVAFFTNRSDVNIKNHWANMCYRKGRALQELQKHPSSILMQKHPSACPEAQTETSHPNPEQRPVIDFMFDTFSIDNIDNEWSIPDCASSMAVWSDEF